MVIYEHLCTECEVTFYTKWVARRNPVNRPNCVNCGFEKDVTYTGEHYEIEKEYDD